MTWMGLALCVCVTLIAGCGSAPATPSHEAAVQEHVVISTEIGGTVVEVPVDFGDPVISGDLLVRLDAREPTLRLDAVRAALAQAGWLGGLDPRAVATTLVGSVTLAATSWIEATPEIPLSQASQTLRPIFERLLAGGQVS